jgi:PAS domain S-box-containing protein
VPVARSSAVGDAWRSIRARSFGPFVAGTVVFIGLLVLALQQASGRFDRLTVNWINALGLVVGGAAVIVSAAIASRRCPRRQRRAWTLLGGSGAFAVLGNGWFAMAAAAGHPELSRIGNLGFLIAAVFAVAGMATFPAVRRRGLELLRIILDGVVVSGSLLLTVTVFALPAVLEAGQNPFLRLDAVVLIAIDTILATVAVMLVIRGDRSDRPVLALLAVGYGCWAFTDLARWVLTVQDYPVFDSPVPLGWVAGYACVAIAAYLPQSIVRPEDATLENQATPITDTVVTFGLLLVAAGATAPRMSSIVSPWVGALWLLLVSAVVLRQIILIADNEQLRRTLQRRVTARTRELASMTRQSELLLNSVGDGIYGVDSHGVITFVNPSAANALGYRAEELIGKHAHDHFHAPQPDGTPYDYQQCYIAEAIAKGLTTNGEDDSYLGADGRPIPVEVTSSPLHSDTSRPGAVIVFRDVTQRREVERMKKEFVSVVSHELRTPLTAIRGSLGLLAGDRLGELSPQARRMVRIALDSSERLGRLVTDILDIDRMESGSMPMDFRDHRVAELIETAVSQLRPIAAEAGVRLTIEETTGGVNADADRVVQTLVNLIGNAIKFSPPGGVVHIGAGHAGAPGMITFTVADQGRGIPQDKLQRVFERFEQVDSSDDREMGGSGLGLSISRSIIERHGGRIWAESPAGGGAIFRFTLPDLGARNDRHQDHPDDHDDHAGDHDQHRPATLDDHDHQQVGSEPAPSGLPS